MPNNPNYRISRTPGQKKRKKRLVGGFKKIKGMSPKDPSRKAKLYKGTRFRPVRAEKFKGKVGPLL